MLKTTKFRFTDVFRPTSIQSCNLWISADSLALNDGDSVTTWTDLSGQGNNVSQSNATYRPLYKTNIINGKPALLFDGANDALYGGNITGSTCFIVAKYTESTSAFQNYDGAFTLHPNFPVFTGTNGTSNWDSALGTYYVNDFQTNTLNLANPFISYVVATQAVTNRIGPIRVGVDRDYTYLNRYWYGYISEIISYSNTLTADQILSVRTYLNKKYATF
jgi:hypothetical protein